ncbi:hypothetical protein LJC46_00960 [Desulfovibrio sp. OttesenSCG-928-G15]|nr:hypothetical protein [Desulfovibrio sp. OttesenSCG-928-G15]
MNAFSFLLPLLPFFVTLVFAVCLNLAAIAVKNFLHSGGFFSYVHYAPAAFPKLRLKASGAMPS